MTLAAGLDGMADLVVGEADTAIALRSGDVPVLGTPRLLALCEEATLRCIEGRIEPGSSTVCVRVQMDHLAPAPLDGRVIAEARLDKVEGRRLLFSISARDSRGLIAAGKVTRVIVEVDRFLEKCGA